MNGTSKLAPVEHEGWCSGFFAMMHGSVWKSQGGPSQELRNINNVHFMTSVFPAFCRKSAASTSPAAETTRNSRSHAIDRDRCREEATRARQINITQACKHRARSRYLARRVPPHQQRFSSHTTKLASADISVTGCCLFEGKINGAGNVRSV